MRTLSLAIITASRVLTSSSSSQFNIDGVLVGLLSDLYQHAYII